jgi:CheY-like chemotaxis protein
MPNSTTILFVDDDVDYQELVLQIVQEDHDLTCKVKVCNNGEEALDYLSSTTKLPRLIVSDINMPRMDGLQLKQEINLHTDRKRNTIPFVYLSTSSHETSIRKAQDVHAQGYFVKSDDYNGFKNTLKCILDYWCSNMVPYRAEG